MHQEAGRTAPAPFRAGNRCEGPLRNRIAPTPVSIRPATARLKSPLHRRTGFIAAFGAMQIDLLPQRHCTGGRALAASIIAFGRRARSDCALIYSAPYLRFAALVQSP
jgi:hypothetical protein